VSGPGGQLALERARRTTFETAEGPIAALSADGEPDAAPVLMLPGYTGSKEDFAPLLGLLADAGFAPAAIDLPGQYESPGPADPAAYVPELLALPVLEIAEQLGTRVHLLGHSFGGLVARAAVIAAPERWSSLVLLCSGPSGIGGQRRAMIEHLEPILAASGLAAVHAAAEALARARPDYVAPPPALAEFLQTRFLAGVPAMLQGMGEALRSEPDRVAELAATGVRTLVAYGLGDDAWPPAVQDEMAHRLGAQRIVIDGAAHSPAVENPDATAAMLTAFWHPGKGD
jgi:pimeloyl-ACP methyl ester carboxylesterase